MPKRQSKSKTIKPFLAFSPSDAPLPAKKSARTPHPCRGYESGPGTVACSAFVAEKHGQCPSVLRMEPDGRLAYFFFLDVKIGT